MKYLKLFDALFYQISSTERGRGLEKEDSDFTPYEIATIQEIFNKKYRSGPKQIIPKVLAMRYKSQIRIENTDVKSNDSYRWYIDKDYDEWFYVYDRQTNTDYKCDSFAGLIAYIKDALYVS